MIIRGVSLLPTILKFDDEEWPKGISKEIKLSTERTRCDRFPFPRGKVGLLMFSWDWYYHAMFIHGFPLYLLVP